MDKYQTTRRGLVLGSLAVMAAGCAQTVQQVVEPISPAFAMDPRYARQRVKYQTSENAGSIVVDTSDRFLYYIEEDGWATRYGVGVGEQGLTLKGRASIGRKAEWPTWTPTAA